MRLLRVCAALVLLCSACGFDVVDFESRSAAPNVDVVVVGAVPQTAIDRLTAGGMLKRDPKQLAFSYPEAFVVVPENVAPLTFRWSAAKPGKMADSASAAVYELSLRTAARELRIYTTELSAAVPAERWSVLLNDSTSAPLTVQLHSLSAGPKAELLESEPQTLLVRDALPAGSLYFETRSGIARARIGDDGTALAYPFASGTPCSVGHAVSRDGTRLGITCADAPGGIWSLPDLSLLRALAQEAGSGSFGSFDPSSTRYVRARMGKLEIVDLLGNLVQALAPLASAAGARMDEPDWSPDGQAIVFTYWPAPAAPEKPAGVAAGSSIARVVRMGDSWSEPQIVVDAPSPMSALHAPQYAPDGSFLVLEGSGGDDMTPGGPLFVRAQGGTLMPLSAMAMKPEMMKAGTRPTWLPSTRAGQAWLAYTSTRDDGSMTPAMMPAMTPAMTQRLWLSAIDLTALPAASAISPAFILPAQGAASESRRALFAPEP